jgi:hypothetical protein
MRGGYVGGSCTRCPDSQGRGDCSGCRCGGSATRGAAGGAPNDGKGGGIGAARGIGGGSAAGCSGSISSRSISGVGCGTGTGGSAARMSGAGVSLSGVAGAAAACGAGSLCAWDSGSLAGRGGGEGDCSFTHGSLYAAAPFRWSNAITGRVGESGSRGVGKQSGERKRPTAPPCCSPWRTLPLPDSPTSSAVWHNRSARKASFLRATNAGRQHPALRGVLHPRRNHARRNHPWQQQPRLSRSPPRN